MNDYPKMLYNCDPNVAHLGRTKTNSYYVIASSPDEESSYAKKGWKLTQHEAKLDFVKKHEKASKKEKLAKDKK